MAKLLPKTKKEKILARNKKLHLILEAERVHERQRREGKQRSNPNKSRMPMGGTSKPQNDEVVLDWRSKAQNIRGRVTTARGKAKSLWRGKK